MREQPYQHHHNWHMGGDEDFVRGFIRQQINKRKQPPFRLRYRVKFVGKKKCETRPKYEQPDLAGTRFLTAVIS